MRTQQVREQTLQKRLDVEGVDVSVAVDVAGAGVAGLRVGIEEQVEEGFDVEDVGRAALRFRWTKGGT